MNKIPYYDMRKEGNFDDYLCIVKKINEECATLLKKCVNNKMIDNEKFKIVYETYKDDLFKVNIFIQQHCNVETEIKKRIDRCKIQNV